MADEGQCSSRSRLALGPSEWRAVGPRDRYRFDRARTCLVGLELIGMILGPSRLTDPGQSACLLHLSRYLTTKGGATCRAETSRSTQRNRSGRPSTSKRVTSARAYPEEEAERRAWATVNKIDRGGEKPGGSGYGKPKNMAPARKGGKLGGRASASRPKAARSASAKKAAATRKRRAAASPRTLTAALDRSR